MMGKTYRVRRPKRHYKEVHSEDPKLARRKRAYKRRKDWKKFDNEEELDDSTY